MKNFVRLLRAIFFILLPLFIIDYSLGKIFDRISTDLPIDGGLTSNFHYALNRCCTDVLVIGSSTALCNYDSRVLIDSLHSSVFNAGTEYSDMLLNSCIFNSIVKRCPPKLVIWSIDINDLVGTNNISRLYPYYDKDELIKESILYKDGKKAKIKMLSNMYKYNSVFLRIITTKIQGTKYAGYCGFYPKTYNTSTVKELKTIILDPKAVDEYLVNRFLKIIALCEKKDIKMIVVRPPIYLKYIGTTDSIELIESICNEHNIIYIDNSQSDYMHDHPEYFYDDSHFNTIGATEYTNMFYSQIKPFIIEF
jgi:hypothetical protein